ncbi:MAG: IS4 family transposase, partial [Planctomycetaceae bacterium]|nr:IS4 family transposase [Planctomycetaceae bacterium]
MWRYRKDKDLTIHEFYMALARLGGHQNRKSDHRPGWLILWRGWTKLQA